MTDTLFKQVGYTVSSLLEFIDLGEIGLPDIQRPFVWKNIKVRDLFDSMYRGYPVGYLLFWQNAFDQGDGRAIGDDKKQKPARLLIVDGQQRLTSLYAVVKGIPVLRENYEKETIAIAFNPLQGRFEVADAAIRRDKSFIPNISDVWNKGLFEIVDEYLEGLESTRDVDEEERRGIKGAISRLHSMTGFPFTALELSANIDEEQVADVFVRINSKGTPLNQADFILTLMSVFWDSGRAELEDFCRRSRVPSKGEASPFNHYIQPDPDQLLRVSVGLGFKRARLKYVYSILRGKDLETELFSDERREAQFDVLKAAQSRTLNLAYWHDFLKAINLAGFRGGRLISSQNNLLFAYILYLMGRTEYHVPEQVLRRAIARWFFMSSLTGRFTGSPESAMEFDLARFREVEDPEHFIRVLDTICEATLTNDFWSMTLPTELATSSPRSPSLFAYFAALALLDAQALFSQQKIVDLLEPSVHSTRRAAERHHLFPKAYLATLGVKQTRDTNQIANYALLEWGDNAEISDLPPNEYLPQFANSVPAKDLERMYYWHALPDGWENMEYGEFLERRRELVSKVIADGYELLCEAEANVAEAEQVVSVEELIGVGETTNVEFKSTLRVNLHTGKRDPRMELATLKTVAGFLNAHGGNLVIGATDDGTALGLAADEFENEDRMYLHFVNLVKDRIGPQFMMYVHPRFEDFDGERVFVIECWRSRSPAYVKDGNDEHFYVRTGAATAALSPSQMQDFIKHRFSS